MIPVIVAETEHHRVERLARAIFWTVRNRDDKILAACKTKRSAIEAAERAEEELELECAA